MRFVLERKIVSEVHVKNILFEKKETHLSHNGRTNSGLCLYKVFFYFGNLLLSFIWNQNCNNTNHIRLGCS